MTRIAEGDSLSFATSTRFLIFLSHTIVKVTKDAEKKSRTFSEYEQKDIHTKEKCEFCFAVELS